MTASRVLRLPILSVSAAIFALALTIGGELWYSHQVELFPLPLWSETDFSSIGSSGPNEAKPASMFDITDRRLTQFFFAAGLVLAGIAVATGVWARAKRDHSHMTATGLALGLGVLVWQVVVYLAAT